MTNQPKSKKPIGRPRIHLVDRKRRNLNIERTPEFDENLKQAQVILANIREVDVSSITQTEIIRVALSFYAHYRNQLGQ